MYVVLIVSYQSWLGGQIMSRGFALTAWKYHSGMVNRNVLTPCQGEFRIRQVYKPERTSVKPKEMHHPFSPP